MTCSCFCCCRCHGNCGSSVCGCRFAFQYNPSLQPRALVVFGCISKRVTHGQIKQIIRILSKASPLLSIDRVSRPSPWVGPGGGGATRGRS